MKPKTKIKSVLELDSVAACKYFLKSKSYCNIDLPPYYTFQEVLNKTYKLYKGLSLNNTNFKAYTNKREAVSLSNINHHIYTNKDGDLSWRDFEIIHPLLYVHLVHTITTPDNWSKIKDRFSVFQENLKIECFSIPIMSLTKESDKAVQVKHWWKSIEQKSIELALEYEYLYDTDIADCYGSIYTHSIAWAVETKEIAKQKMRDKSLLGNNIDEIIQTMQQGQTNGIPQGSNLMDFIAELVLGYIDNQISNRLDKTNIVDYRIFRYRDDYKVFVNNPVEGAIILKIISEELLSMGMRLNSSKTKKSDDVITTAIKSDKLDWLINYNYSSSPQQKLLLIREHARKHPNSGTLKKELQKFYNKLDKYYIHPDSILVLTSILTDICYRSPATYTIYFAISSKLINLEKDKSKKDYIINVIYKKFKSLPNTGFMQIWFKRMIRSSRQDIDLDEKLCKYIDSPKSIWNNKWISNSALKKCLKETSIVNMKIYNSLDEIIQGNEFSLFNYNDRK